MPFTISELSARIFNRSISPVELTHDCLDRIEKLNPTLNAFITVTAESALDRARRAEWEIFHGTYLGPLHGIPIGLKDIIDTAGVHTTAASALFKDRIPTEDAQVVRRLRRGGAIILGKQNLHEFAYGGSSIISFFGEVHNPWDPKRIAGGSSGGSAASVAAGLGFAAVGTDTAGSIRLPAAYCGVVGVKPTYGRVSTRGVVPLASSYDHVGPLTNSVYDAALMMQVLSDYDSPNPRADRPAPSLVSAFDDPPTNLRIGIPRPFFFGDLDPEVATAIEKAIQVFAGLRQRDSQHQARGSDRPHAGERRSLCLSQGIYRALTRALPAGYAGAHPVRSRHFRPRRSPCERRPPGEPSRHPGNISMKWTCC